MKGKKKHVNPKDFLHQVYTVEKGVKEHNKNQRAMGVLEAAFGILVFTRIIQLLSKIENIELKVDKESDKQC